MAVLRRLVACVVFLLGIVAFSTEACAGAAHVQDVLPLGEAWEGRIEVAGMNLGIRGVFAGQAEAIVRAEGGDPAMLAAAGARQDLLFRAVRTSEGWDKVADAARASTGMPAMGARPDPAVEAAITAQIASAMSGWFRFSIDYDPLTALSQLTCPVLALCVALDTQVLPGPNVAALEAALARAGCEDVTTKVYAGSKHLFIPARTGAPSEYAALEKRFVPALLEDLSGWIAARVKR